MKDIKIGGRPLDKVLPGQRFIFNGKEYKVDKVREIYGRWEVGVGYHHLQGLGIAYIWIYADVLESATWSELIVKGA